MSPEKRLLSSKYRVAKKQHLISVDKDDWYRDYFDNENYTKEVMYASSVTLVLDSYGQVVALREGADYFIIDIYDRVSIQTA